MAISILVELEDDEIVLHRAQRELDPLPPEAVPTG